MKNKKFLLSLLTLAILLPSAVSAKEFTNNKGIDISEQEYNNLINLGFDDLDISNMDSQTFNENKDIEAIIVGTDTVYFKTLIIPKNPFSTYSYNNSSEDMYDYIDVEITKEEYENESGNNNGQIMPLAAEENTEYKRLQTTLSYVSSSRQYRATTKLTWKKMPARRSHDIIGMTYTTENAAMKQDTQKALTSYTVNDSCLATTTGYSDVHTSPWTLGAGGAGISFKLPSNSTKTYSWNELLGTTYPCVETGPSLGHPGIGSETANLNVKSIQTTLYYDLAKMNTGKNLTVYGSYKHAQKSVSINPSFSFGTGGAGISISPSISTKYDSMNNTMVQIANPQW